jgi:hypothetical protein
MGVQPGLAFKMPRIIGDELSLYFNSEQRLWGVKLQGAPQMWIYKECWTFYE